MIIDQCLGTGREFTREELQAEVNKGLESRGMLPVRSKGTILQDIGEMNEKFYRFYQTYGIVSEQRGRKHYYRYRDGIESIYNRELTAEKVLLIALAFLIIRLFCSVKQAAGILDGVSRLPTKAFYRLTPDFFRILMPCSSQMSISVFSARLRSFSN